MDKTSRRDLIKQLVEQKKSVKTHKAPTKLVSKVDFIAYVDPTEQDVMDELVRMDGFTKKQ